MKRKFNHALSAISYEKIAFFFIWVGIILVIGHLFLFYYDDILLSSASNETLQTLGQFGEYYGGMIGAMWSLASVILFYEALKFQRNELTLQRHELELNRQELLEQTEQYRDQNRLLRIQNLENTFFQLMLLHTEIVKSISLEVKSGGESGIGSISYVLHGRDCFEEFYKEFRAIFDDHVDLLGLTSPNKEDMLEMINESYNKFLRKYHTTLGHYLRNLYSIASFIDTSAMENKNFFKKLLTAQLSDIELALQFYYCLSKKGADFKPLVEKYSLFENIPKVELIDMRHMELYHDKAFKA